MAYRSEKSIAAVKKKKKKKKSQFISVLQRGQETKHIARDGSGNKKEDAKERARTVRDKTVTIGEGSCTD